MTLRNTVARSGQIRESKLEKYCMRRSVGRNSSARESSPTVSCGVVTLAVVHSTRPPSLQSCPSCLLVQLSILTAGYILDRRSQGSHREILWMPESWSTMLYSFHLSPCAIIHIAKFQYKHPDWVDKSLVTIFHSCLQLQGSPVISSGTGGSIWCMLKC